MQAADEQSALAATPAGAGVPLVRQLTADALRILTGQTAWTIASMLAGVVVVRALGPSGKGSLAYATTVVTLATTAFGGVTTAAMIAVARRGVDRTAAERATFRIAAVAGTAVAAILLAVGLAVREQWALIGSAAALVPALYVAATQTMLQYRGDVKRAVWMQQISGTALVLAIAAVAIAGGGVAGAFACWVALLALAAVGGRGGLRATSSPGHAARGVIGAVGVATTLLAVVSYLNLTIDVFVVAALRPAAELGIYTLAIASGEMLWMLSRSLLWPALGPIAHLERAEAALLAARLCRYAVALVGAGAIVAWFAAPFAIRLVYGAPFSPASDVLRIVLPGIVAMAGESVLGSFIVIALGRARTLLAVQSVATLACAAICVAGLPRYGLAAAAFATSLTYCAVFLATVWMAVRGGVSVRRLLRG